jgi:hypothetical protein
MKAEQIYVKTHHARKLFKKLHKMDYAETYIATMCSNKTLRGTKLGGWEWLIEIKSIENFTVPKRGKPKMHRRHSYKITPTISKRRLTK